MIHKADSIFAPACDVEGDHAAAAFRQVFFGKCMVTVCGKPRVVDRFHFRVFFEELCNEIGRASCRERV